MIKHPNTLAGIIALLVFCGIFLQLVLMIQAPTSDSIFEVIIRFFSYFTILSNLIVFAYFISKALSAELGENGFWTKPETSTAVTVYITVVGLVYHIVLSKIHNPQGLAKIADHGLHSFTPLVTLLYWFVFVSSKKVNYNSIPYWLLYPAFYFVYTIIHGALTQFYPYPFLDVNKIGLLQSFLNCLVVLVLFTFLSLLFSFISNWRFKKSSKSS
ncbi:Pr6Pr family membrane protein [Sediminibacterium sp.]|uniref:Pr6Pr family membrane protein n=1 Tax=Sediminibacterium sp. TaxID=1917865 RepID=UPI00273356C0|nr:Pr6Pr family membrane protein [Sediminibacterium sp.]MDP3392609.1 Pr6Pr family membrane protein [Sediminibacterium sp.]MDP3566148.1 Pr6Pr family membrane protein [Sediminibacterium sp.]